MQKVKSVLCWLLAVFFVLGGINHFRTPVFYQRMIPPYLPWPSLLVSLSGVAEMTLGLLVIFSRTRRFAGWGLIALLIAVFPANLQMALHPETFPELSPRGLWMRLPFQILFIAWVWWCTQSSRMEKKEKTR